jgi:hypothetical protein
MVVKKIINDRQRARRVYGFVQRLPDPVTLGAAESNVAMFNLDWKESVRFASTGNISLPPGDPLQAIDGTILDDGDRILLKDQLTASENGIYVVNLDGGTWDRAVDAIPGDTLTCGAVTYVEDGVVNGGNKWIVSTKHVVLGNDITWVLFDRGNDWIVSGSGGQMKTSDPVAIGNEGFPSEIADDVFLYVSGSRHYGQSIDRGISLFTGDVTISGTVNMTTSDGFYGNLMEVSGSLRVTTGSFALQNADTNDYMFFVDSKTGNTTVSGSMFFTGSMSQGYGSAATGLSSQATGLFALAQSFGQFSHGGSGLGPDYLTNTLGQGFSQYTRHVWTAEASIGDSETYFMGYDNIGVLSKYLYLEDGKAYHVKSSAIITEAVSSPYQAALVREALIYVDAGTAYRVVINDTLSMPGTAIYDFDINVDSTGSFDSLTFRIIANDVGTSPPNTFANPIRGTVTIEMSEILGYKP